MPLAADVQQIIGSAMPLVLILGFAVIALLRRRDRRLTAEEEREEEELRQAALDDAR